MLIPYLMKVSLVLAVLTLAYRWLIQFETFSKLNRILLWLNVVAAWTLPLINLPDWGPVAVQTEFHQSIPKVVDKLPVLGQPISGIQAEPFKAQASAAAIPALTINDWITAIYFAGMGIMAVYFLFQIRGLFIVVAKGRAEQCADGTSIVRVAGTSPYSFFKWIVLDPSKHSAPELRNIVAHEAEHARQWHSADLLLAEIQKICLWFNPFAWVHQKLVQENLEYLADRAVLDNGFEKKQYQYDLLNAVMQSRELPLTNSFAQSLLKKRIKMMNRKPSHYLVCGKYVAVIALIYISSAFVAPYREQIVELAPEVIRPIVKPLVNNAVSEIHSKSDSVVSPQETIIPDRKPDFTATADSIETVPENGKKTKGILIVNKTLYWAITPLTTWEDLNEFKDVFKKFGQNFQVSKIEFDPLQQYITAISVRISSKGGLGTGGEQGIGEFVPMKGYSGYVSGNGDGMGFLPPEPLRKEMEDDYQKALAMAKENAVAYFEYKLGQSLGIHTTTTYTRQLLTGPNAEMLYQKNGFGKSDDNTLRISEYHKNSTFYLNTSPSTFVALNEIPLSKLERVTLLEDNARRKYIVVYAE